MLVETGIVPAEQGGRIAAALENLMLVLPLRVGHALPRLQIAAGGKYPIAGAGQHDAAYVGGIGDQPGP